MIDRSELVTMLLEELKGTHVLAVPLAHQILELAGETTPVPPLPTEPYTVIRVTWKPPYEERPDVLMLVNDGHSWQCYGQHDTPRYLADRISAFEVLSERRAVIAKAVRAEFFADVSVDARHDRENVRRETAKAVLDRISDELDDGMRREWLTTIAREFGVSP